MPTLLADLVRRQVAVIAATGSVPTLAAKAATATIPIVFGVGEDPVKLGLVASLARPGGNLTGINFFANELAAKRLAFLHELVPKAVRIAALVNPANTPSTETALRELPDAARAIGLEIQVLNASTRSEIEAPFATLARDRSRAVPEASRARCQASPRRIASSRSNTFPARRLLVIVAVTCFGMDFSSCTAIRFARTDAPWELTGSASGT